MIFKGIFYLQDSAMNAGSYILFLTFLVPVTSICRDRHALCDLWLSQGACKLIPEYMQKNCRKRCGFCDLPTKSPKTSTPRPPAPKSPLPDSSECEDEHVSCSDWSTAKVCKRNGWMQNNCKRRGV